MRAEARVALLVAAAAVALSATGTVGTAAAASAGGNGGTFGLNPTPSAEYPGRAYFDYTAVPGESIHDTVTLSNDTTAPEELDLSVSVGRTATTSGLAYGTTAGPCTGAACWIEGVPHRVELPPGTATHPATLKLPFTVEVPAHVRAGQYLAGITATPAATTTQHESVQHGKVGMDLKVVDEVTVGIAVTVGEVAQLPSRFAIPDVGATVVDGTLPRLLVHVRNTGRTFVEGVGTAACLVDGRRRSTAADAQLTLPGQSAVLPVNARDLAPDSTYRCVVRIRYGVGKVAVWRGRVRVPPVDPATVERPTAPGLFSGPVTVSASRTLIEVLGGVIVVLLLLVAGLLAFVLRRRRS